MLEEANAVVLRPEIINASFPFALPRLICSSGETAQRRYIDFFAATIRNTHARRAYARATVEFLGWCSLRGVMSLGDLQPLHVATWIEQISRGASAPTVKQRLAAVRHLFDWLVIGQGMAVNPAASVRGPSHSVRRGMTPLLDPKETRMLLAAIDLTTPMGLRDRALIGLMVYSFAHIGTALAMRVEDVFVQNCRLWVRLQEKGAKQHEMPCHHNLEEYLTGYLDGCALREDRKAPLFRTIVRGTKRLSDTPLAQASAFQMVRRRAVAAGIETAIGSHSFRATGITGYLKNGGTLERPAMMAYHASRTTQLYDRRCDEVTLDKIERVLV